MDNYELCENIGCGSFGKVYHARDLRTNSDVAVKIVDVVSDTNAQSNVFIYSVFNDANSHRI